MRRRRCRWDGHSWRSLSRSESSRWVAVDGKRRVLLCFVVRGALLLVTSFSLAVCLVGTTAFSPPSSPSPGRIHHHFSPHCLHSYMQYDNCITRKCPTKRSRSMHGSHRHRKLVRVGVCPLFGRLYGQPLYPPCSRPLQPSVFLLSARHPQQYHHFVAVPASLLVTRQKSNDQCSYS